MVNPFIVKDHMRRVIPEGVDIRVFRVEDMPEGHFIGAVRADERVF